MNVVSGFISADEGSVSVDGAERWASRPTACAQAASRAFQNLQMFSDMTTVEAVVTGRLRGIARHRSSPTCS